MFSATEELGEAFEVLRYGNVTRQLAAVAKQR